MVGIKLYKIAVSEFSIINDLTKKQRSMNSLLSGLFHTSCQTESMIEIQLQLKPYGIVEIIEKSGGIKKQRQNPVAEHAKEQ